MENAAQFLCFKPTFNVVGLAQRGSVGKLVDGNAEFGCLVAKRKAKELAKQKANRKDFLSDLARSDDVAMMPMADARVNPQQHAAARKHLWPCPQAVPKQKGNKECSQKSKKKTKKKNKKKTKIKNQTKQTHP
jgi:hypothetical protein